jgi:hypothetical protein
MRSALLVLILFQVVTFLLVLSISNHSDPFFIYLLICFCFLHLSGVYYLVPPTSAVPARPLRIIFRYASAYCRFFGKPPLFLSTGPSVFWHDLPPLSTSAPASWIPCEWHKLCSVELLCSTTSSFQSASASRASGPPSSYRCRFRSL